MKLPKRYACPRCGRSVPMGAEWLDPIVDCVGDGSQHDVAVGEKLYAILDDAIWLWSQSMPSPIDRIWVHVRGALVVVDPDLVLGWDSIGAHWGTVLVTQSLVDAIPPLIVQAMVDAIPPPLILPIAPGETP